MGLADTRMLKLLIFERSCLICKTGAMIQQNFFTHFKRSHPSNTNVCATKFRVAKDICICFAKTIASMEHNVETSAAVADRRYVTRRGKPLLNGTIKGKVDVPQLCYRAPQRRHSG